MNGLSDKCHPLQALADLLTLQEQFGELKGLKLAYLGDGNNMACSLMLTGAAMGVSVSVATPAAYAAEPGHRQARDLAGEADRRHDLGHERSAGSG